MVGGYSSKSHTGSPGPTTLVGGKADRPTGHPPARLLCSRLVEGALQPSCPPLPPRIPQTVRKMWYRNVIRGRAHAKARRCSRSPSRERRHRRHGGTCRSRSQSPPPRWARHVDSHYTDQYMRNPSMGRPMVTSQHGHAHPHVSVASPPTRAQSSPLTGKQANQRRGDLPQPCNHPTNITPIESDEFFRPQEPPSSLKPATECMLKLSPVANNQQGGYVLESRRFFGFVALPLPLASLVSMPGALVNVTLVRGLFDYTDLQAQWSSHCVVYLFGQAAARLRDRFAREQVFPLESDRVYTSPQALGSCRGPT